MSVPTIVVCVTHNFRMIGTTNLEEVEVVASVYYEHFYLFWDDFWAYETVYCNLKKCYLGCKSVFKFQGNARFVCSKKAYILMLHNILLQINHLTSDINDSFKVDTL